MELISSGIVPRRVLGRQLAFDVSSLETKVGGKHGAITNLPEDVY